MPRNSRNNMTGTVFHVMCQGINKEYIFSDDYLKYQYKKIIKSKSKENNIEIFAYCIMDNHVHLLLKTENINQMSTFMKQVNTTYGMFYNKVKNRVGYVFRNRYLSKSIKTYNQLQRCIAYIHKNPVVANMVKYEYEYKYSSYSEYLKPITDKSIICANTREFVFGTNDIKSIISSYNLIHHYKDDVLNEFDSFKDKEKVITKDLIDKYMNLGENEIIINLNQKEGISERELAKYFQRTRYQIRKILNV